MPLIFTWAFMVPMAAPPGQKFDAMRTISPRLIANIGVSRFWRLLELLAPLVLWWLDDIGKRLVTYRIIGELNISKSVRHRTLAVGHGRRWSAIIIAVTALCILLTLATQDIVTASSVSWKPVTIEGTQVFRAAGLIVQEEKDGVLWASDGFSIYRSDGDLGFEKVHTVRPSPGKIWAAYSRTLRRMFDVQEIVDVLPLRPDLLLVFVGGEIRRVDLTTGEEEVVHRLRYFGPDEGRGLMPHGLTVDPDGSIYYGEYVTRRLKPGETVAVFRSDDQGRSWHIVFEFPAITVRHVHAVQWDPYGQAIWMGTGDGDEQSRLGYSTDQGQTFTWVGHGSQTFRTVSFVFQEDNVVWLSDTSTMPSRAMRWHRQSSELTLSNQTLPGHGQYLQAIGNGYSLATTAEEVASLWLLGPDGVLHRIFEWLPEAGDIGSLAVIRLARGRSTDDRWLYFSPLRTDQEEVAIYRMSRQEILEIAAAAPPSGRHLPVRNGS